MALGLALRAECAIVTVDFSHDHHELRSRYDVADTVRGPSRVAIMELDLITSGSGYVVEVDAIFFSATNDCNVHELVFLPKPQSNVETNRPTCGGQFVEF